MMGQHGSCQLGWVSSKVSSKAAVGEARVGGREVLPDVGCPSLSGSLGCTIDASASSVADVTAPSRQLLSQLKPGR
jgi:hypothetical protein